MLGASFLAASVVPLSTSYAVADALGQPRSVISQPPRPRCFTVSSPCRSVGAGGSLAPGNLVALVVDAQVLNGVITPMLLTYVLILANRRSVLGDAVNGRIFNVVVHRLRRDRRGAVLRRPDTDDRRPLTTKGATERAPDNAWRSRAKG